MAATSPPLFSVVVPTHRRDDWLRVALASALAQSEARIEVLVVDDAASQATRELVESCGDERARYLVNARSKGAPGARNTGIHEAAGEWVAFLDDDDAWTPERLERIGTLIDSADERLGLVYSASASYDFEAQRVLGEVAPRLRGDALDALLYSNAIGGLSVAVIRRDALIDEGGFDERFPALQDMELYVRIARRHTIDFDPHCSVYVRHHAHSGRISNDPAKKLAGVKLFSEKYADLIRRSPKLRHRDASRRFVFALAARDLATWLRSVPWTLAGVFVDPGNLGYVVKSSARSVRTAFGHRRAAPHPYGQA